MKTWLKGGLIGAGILILILIADFIFLCKFGAHMGEGCGLFTIFAILPIIPILKSRMGNPMFIPLAIFLGLLFYFILGSLIGVIIGSIIQKVKR